MTEKIVEEKKLIEELLGGSEKALNRFYRIYGKQLAKFISIKINDKSDADEILQDSLIAALDSLVLYSGRSPLFSWLCGVARHECADFYRRRKIRSIVFSRLPIVENFVSKALEPEASLMRREYEKEIGQTMKQILPNYRRVLEMKYMDGMSVREISRLMGMSFKACESTLTRARRAFELAYEQKT